MSRHLVFVYGTLKKGEPNHNQMTSSETEISKFVSNAKTVEKFPLVIASKYNTPYMLYRPESGNRVFGEIYSVNDKMLARLDQLERVPTMYTRLETRVTLDDGTECFPWIYFIVNYRPKLLVLKTFDNYSSYGEHGLRYVLWKDRPNDNYDIVSDIKLNS